MYCTSHNRSVFVPTFIGLAFLLLPNIVGACVGVAKPTVVQAYEDSDVVIIARAISIEKTADPSQNPMPTNPVRSSSLAVSVQLIERRIYLIRNHKVMIDVDLAELYGVPTHRINEQVKRNRKRFPEDFMFQLTKDEAECLRSQFAISKTGRGGRRTLPYVFTEQGVAMLSSVLNSERAIEVNITIMRTFVKLRQMLESNEELNRKFAAVIRKLSIHDKYFKVVFDELRKLTEQPTPTRKQIGFKADRKS